MEMKYRRCGHSGLLLSEISLGLWHNFGGDDNFHTARSIVLTAFDRGVTVFDLANNYGPPPGAAELTFGRILRDDLAFHRNRMIITTKAGYKMWDGPYGEGGSRKYLIASCDESLDRLGVDYVDIFYSHRYDSTTPLEETMGALDYIVRSGRALYVGLSNYSVDAERHALEILHRLGTPCVVDQLKYSLLVRKPEEEHFKLHIDKGLGCVSYSPLAQGQLTARYVDGIPADSRAARENSFLKVDEIYRNNERVRALAQIAEQRGQSLSQMAIAWQLAEPRRITSVIIGASRVEQLEENLLATDNIHFSDDELRRINEITL